MSPKKVIWESQVRPSPFAYTWGKVPRAELRCPQACLFLGVGAGAGAQLHLSPLALLGDLLRKRQLSRSGPATALFPLGAGYVGGASGRSLEVPPSGWALWRCCSSSFLLPSSAPSVSGSFLPTRLARFAIWGRAFCLPSPPEDSGSRPRDGRGPGVGEVTSEEAGGRSGPRRAPALAAEEGSAAGRGFSFCRVPA